MKTLDDGSYVEIDGRNAVRFVRDYPHALERVWRAVTDPDEMRHWFPSPEVSYEARVGGSIRLGGDPYDPAPRISSVLVWDPPHRFGFEWGEDQLFFNLTEIDAGCRLELVDVLSAQGAAARNAAGWEMCLEQLALTVAGSPGGGAHEGEMSDFLPVLERYKAKGLPDDGWLPDQT